MSHKQRPLRPALVTDQVPPWLVLGRRLEERLLRTDRLWGAHGVAPLTGGARESES